MKRGFRPGPFRGGNSGGGMTGVKTKRPTRTVRRRPRASAYGSCRPLRLHAGHSATRVAATERTRPEAALHLRVEGGGVTLRTYRGVNSCKFGGGPNGIRTRV